MRHVSTSPDFGQRRSRIAAAVLTFSIAASWTAARAETTNDVSERSKLALAPTLEFERRAAAAFKAKSLAALQGLYSELKDQATATEALLDKGTNASGCDVALTNLLILTGFAINKLDGEGRYEPWMADESLRLLENYQNSATDCATDAKTPPARPQLTVQHVKAL